MKQTLKVAELATFIYAILFFGSLCINMSYYYPFGISIVAYMESWEIFLLFLKSFDLYIPFLIALVLMHPILFKNEYQVNSIKRTIYRLNNFICIGFTIAILISLLILDNSNFWTLWPISISLKKLTILNILFISMMIYYALSMFFPNRIMGEVFKLRLKRYGSTSIGMKAELYLINIISGGSNIKEKKNTINKYIWIINHKFLYLVLVIYVLSIAVMSVRNFSEAYNYKNGLYKPNINIRIVSGNQDIDTQTDDVIYLGECHQYIFLYDLNHHYTQVLNRKDISLLLIKKQLPFNVNKLS